MAGRNGCRFNVLVNNAGIFRIAGIADTDQALWDDTMGINQTGVFLGMQTVGRTPLGRVAEASDVGNLALFLASDRGSYCTGSEFVIDGGFTT